MTLKCTILTQLRTKSEEFVQFLYVIDLVEVLGGVNGRLNRLAIQDGHDKLLKLNIFNFNKLYVEYIAPISLLSLIL